MSDDKQQRIQQWWDDLDAEAQTMLIDKGDVDVLHADEAATLAPIGDITPLWDTSWRGPGRHLSVEVITFLAQQRQARGL